jgi:hypothetical protein
MINPHLEVRLLKYPMYPILLLACSVTVSADHKPDADWSWHLQSSGTDATRLVVYQRDQRFGIYDLDFDPGDVTEGHPAYDSTSEAKSKIGGYLEFYNQRRPHSKLDRLTPDQIYFNSLTSQEAE